MRLSIRRPAFVTAIVIALASTSPHAETVFGYDFSLNKVVSHDATFIQLTRSDLNFDSASAFVKTPLQLEPGASFEVMFGFKILGGTNGADGMTLAFRSDGPGFIGQTGGNLGFYSVADRDGNPLPFGPAYGIALDTWRNGNYGDTGDNNVSFLDHTTYQVRKTQAAPYDLNQGSEFFVWADYDGQNKTMSVFLSDTSSRPMVPLITDSIDLPAWLGSSTYLGITAATGGSTNDHYVTAFSITPVPEPSAWSLLAAGLAALALIVQRRKVAI